MKKSLILLLLSLSAVSTSGCGEQEEPTKDPTEIVDIEIVGDLVKKSYDYEDEWDFSGISVDGIQRNKDRVHLKSNQYKLTSNVASPKKLGNALLLTAKYSKKLAISDTKTIKDVYVADERYDEQSELSAYYVDCNTEFTGSKLINELHRHSFSKHTKFVSYGDVKNYITKGGNVTTDSTDLVPGIHNTEYFYTGALSNYNAGTKEHVWACNDSAGLWVHSSDKSDKHCVDNVSYIGGGSDLYHVRPSGSDTNTARGDAPFIDFDDFGYLTKININYDGSDLKFYASKSGYKTGKLTYADYVEPPDQYKGDIARIVAYLYMHYRTNSNTPSDYKYMTGYLNLTSVIGYSSESRCIEILKKWNKIDKPSDVEKHRNHVVQQIQGNRNPFVDYPNLLDQMFE